jgi:hypothetical protein
MKTFAVALLLVVGSTSYAAQGDPSSASTAPLSRPLPEGTQISLRFLADRVATGAIPTIAHQANFEVRAVDANGKPRSGIAVPLPVIVRGGRGTGPGLIGAGLAWTDKTAKTAEGLGITGADGVARGVFTSGNVMEVTKVKVPGTEATAEIEQVWNQLVTEKDAWEGSDYWVKPQQFRYSMRYERTVIGEDGKATKSWEPITGHKMHLRMTELTLGEWSPLLGPDSNGDGLPDGAKQERKVSSTDADLTQWTSLQQYITIGAVVEVEPGVYASSLSISPPQDAAGETLFDVEDRKFFIYDDVTYDVPLDNAIEE